MMRVLPVLFILSITGSVLPAGQPKGPAIEFDSIARQISQPYIDGEVVYQVFKFANKGDATLEIKSVEPSCGCTSAVPSPNKIAPGQSGTLDVEITTAGVAALSRTLTETVNLSKTVTVTTNDPKNSSVVLTVSYTVVPEIVLSEPAIWFGNNPRNKEVVKELMIEIAPDRPIQILGAVSTDRFVTVKLEPVPGSNGKKIKAILVQKPDAVEGLHFGNIMLKTSSKLKPEVQVTVRGIVTKGN